jgi:orotate phosphoribosyltransferase
MEGCFYMKREVAGALLEIGAVSLQPDTPFTWSSGLKSPIYCDNRLTLSFPEVRRKIAEGLSSLINEYYPGTEVVAGTATAGIPHAAWVAERMDLPMSYVRSKAKGHGKGNQIEGRVLPGQKVVVVEDLISTGGSVIEAVQALRSAGCVVLGVVSIFTYELEKGRQQLEESEIKAYSLTDFTTLANIAEEKGLISKQNLESLAEWRKNPSEWGAAHSNL